MSARPGRRKIESERYRIEGAMPEDVRAMRTLVREAWLELYPNERYGISREDIEEIDWFNLMGMEKQRKDLENPNIRVWVARDTKDKTIGFCKASRNVAEDGDVRDREIEAIYVTTAHKKSGVGGRLIKRALRWLGTDSYIKLEVVRYNLNAINFYKKFGFEETENKVSNKSTQLPSGKHVQRVVMVRKGLQNKAK
jgi:ribosomal protein S18 acetylase RimI-like enzyme